MKWRILLTISLLSLTLCACDERLQEKIVGSVGNHVTEGIKETAEEKISEKTKEAGEVLKDLTSSVKEENHEGLSTNRFDVTLSNCYDGDTCTFKAVEEVAIDLEQGEVVYHKGDKIKVRFILIDAKEMKDDKTGQPEKWAVEAKERTTELLENAESITLELENEKFDHYGRLLAYVYHNSSKTVQEVLLEEGLVEVAYIFENTRYLKEFTNAQAKAQALKVGLWNED